MTSKIEYYLKDSPLIIARVNYDNTNVPAWAILSISAHLAEVVIEKGGPHIASDILYRALEEKYAERYNCYLRIDNTGAKPDTEFITMYFNTEHDQLMYMLTVDG